MKQFLVLITLILALSVIPAFADTLTPIGTPIPTGSWTQQFQENGVGPFGEMLFIMNTPGITFGDGGNPTGINGFNPNIGAASDWDSTLESGGTVSHAFDNSWGGESSLPTDMTFFLTFSSNQNVPFSFNFYAYDGWKPNLADQLVDSATVKWDGNNWSVAPLEQTNSAVPEPASVALFSTGLTAFAGIIRRKLKR